MTCWIFWVEPAYDTIHQSCTYSLAACVISHYLLIICVNVHLITTSFDYLECFRNIDRVHKFHYLQ